MPGWNQILTDIFHFQEYESINLKLLSRKCSNKGTTSFPLIWKHCRAREEYFMFEINCTHNLVYSCIWQSLYGCTVCILFNMHIKMTGPISIILCMVIQVDLRKGLAWTVLLHLSLKRNIEISNYFYWYVFQAIILYFWQNVSIYYIIKPC